MINRIKNKVRFIWRTSWLGRVKKRQDAIRWGIIGTGYMSDVFSRAIIESQDHILYAVASRSKDKAVIFAVKHGCGLAFGSYEDMVADRGIDVVYIATPVECHYEHVKLCLEAGKNVLCEKPLTMTPEQSEELARLADSRNLFLMEGMWTLCLPTIRKAKEWIDGGLIGEPQFVRVDLNKRMRESHIGQHHGVLFDYGIYGVAFLRKFIGKDGNVISSVVRRDKNGFVTDLTAEYSSCNCKGVLNLSSHLEATGKSVIIGSKGCIEWGHPFNRTNVVRLFDNEGKLLSCYQTKYSNEGFEFELKEVYVSIKAKSGVSSLVPLDMTVDCLNIIKKICNG